jgi:hypothetical protein
MEPISAISLSLLGTIIGGIIGNRADGLFCQALVTINERIKECLYPVNHDIERTIRRSIINATLTVCEAYLLELKASSSKLDTVKNYFSPSNDTKWVKSIQHSLKSEKKRLNRKDYLPSISEADKNFFLLLSPRDNVAFGRVSELKNHLQQQILLDLALISGEIPERFSEMLMDGWSVVENKEDDTSTKYKWFDTVCAFFRRELKTNSHVQRVFESEILANLMIGEYPLDVSAFFDQLNIFGQTVYKKLDKIGSELEQQKNILLETEEKLDSITAFLINLPEVKDQIELIAKKSYRQSLKDKYVGREISVRTEQYVFDRDDTLVGRENAYLELNNFLSTQESGRILITAGAGYGKTTFLSNWIKTNYNNQCFIAYHFFSQGMFSLTEAYINLLRQLYTYYELEEELIPSDNLRLRDILFGLIEEKGARRGEPLIIIIDALDESEQPFTPPFPKKLPQGVFLIASARHSYGERQEYLDGWDSESFNMNLSLINRQQIEELLSNQENELLRKKSKEAEFPEKILALTDGLPLYVHHLLDEFQVNEEGLNNIDSLLENTPKGFEAYIRKQLKHLAKVNEIKQYRELQMLFSLLTVALGPLSDEDIQALTNLTLWDLETLPWQVTRWINIQKSPDNTFYSFSHSLLAKEFSITLGRQAAEALTVLTNYCENWEKNKSEYVMRYYPKHLLIDDRMDVLSELLVSSPKWMETKYSVFHDDMSYKSDLENAIYYFKDPLPNSQFEKFFKLYAALQLIEDRSFSNEPYDLEILVQIGEEEKAVDFVLNRKTTAEKITGLLEIIKFLQGNRLSDTKLTEEAVKLTDSLNSIEEKISSLIKILETRNASEPDSLTEELCRKVESLISILPDGKTKVVTQLDLAIFLPADRKQQVISQTLDFINENVELKESLVLPVKLYRAGVFDEAVKIICEQKTNSYSTLKELLLLSSQYRREEDFKKVLEILLRKIKVDLNDKYTVAGFVEEQIFKINIIESFPEIANQILEEVDAALCKAEELEVLVTAYVKLNFPEKAYQAVTNAGSPFLMAIGYCSYISVLTDSSVEIDPKIIEEFKERLNLLEEEELRRIADKVTGALIKFEQIEKAENFIKKLEDDTSNTSLQLTFIEALAKNGKELRAFELLVEQDIKKEEASTIYEIIKQMIKSGLIDESKLLYKKTITSLKSQKQHNNENEIYSVLSILGLTFQQEGYTIVAEKIFTLVEQLIFSDNLPQFLKETTLTYLSLCLSQTFRFSESSFIFKVKKNN